MGLDCYFKPPGVRFPENCLLSEVNSFRGRRYAPFFAALGFNLYQEILDVAAIQALACSLQTYLAQYPQAASGDTLVWWSPNDGQFYNITLRQLRQLSAVFAFAAAHRLSLFNHS